MNTVGYAATSSTAPLRPFRFQRRDVRDIDVEIEILFCGVCHTDLHIARNEWNGTTYPVVPGHEIVGRITRAGKKVTSFTEGQLVAVGCIVGACASCTSCRNGLEQYCENGFTMTYNSPDAISGGVTYGGYSDKIVVEERFLLRIPSQFRGDDLAAVAPLLCAGITTYSPLKYWNIGKGDTIGVIGLGGLGHMAVQLGHALGAHVVLFTRSEGKAQDAHRFGAAEVVISSRSDEVEKHKNRLTFILDTVSASHDLNPYLELVKRDGTICLVGLPQLAHPAVNVVHLVKGRKKLSGSIIGGIGETQEMLEFCAQHGITSDIELIPIQKINEAYERLLKSDVRYRFVIDMGS